MPKEIGEVPKLNKDKWTFLVCQEGFFSKTHALNDFLAGNIVKYCKLLSEKNQKLIICVNFLHEFESDAAKEWLKNYTAPRNDISKEIVRYNETTPSPAEHKIGAEGFALLEQNYDWALYGKPNFIDETSRNQKIKFKFIGERRLANYSLIIHNGKLVAIYRKGFYAKERDELIRNGYVYEFGDFKTKAIEESPIFDALFNCHSSLCRLFICADINLFNEKNYQCETAQQLNFDDCGLFVIQSNTFAGLSTSQLPYLGMLPSIFANKKSLIIHVDPQYGPSVGFINDGGEFLASWPFVPKSVMVTQDGQFECKSTIDAYQYPYHSNGRRIHFGCKGVEFRSNKCIINVWGVVDRNMLPMRNIKRGIL